jgi:hypothetical protein
VCIIATLQPVHAKTVKNTETTDGQKNEIQRKNKENNYSRPKCGTKKKVYFENTGTEGSVFYCIFLNTTDKYLYWHHAQRKERNRKRKAHKKSLFSRYLFTVKYRYITICLNGNWFVTKINKTHPFQLSFSASSSKLPNSKKVLPLTIETWKLLRLRVPLMTTITVLCKTSRKWFMEFFLAQKQVQ